jgi:hypothetical protein
MITIEQRWAPALFSRFQALALVSAKARETSESAERVRKNTNTVYVQLSPSHTGNPVLEPKAAGQGKSKSCEQDV